MPISLFNSDEKPRKPSFFERVRSAVTGEDVDTAAPAPSVPYSETIAPQTATELLEREGAGTMPIEAPEAITPAALHALEDETIAHELGSEAVAPAPVSTPDPQRNQFGLKPMTSNFSFGGYASAEEEDASFLGKMRDAVERTRTQLGASLEGVLALGRTVDEETLDDLEAALLTADIGSTTTSEIMRNLRQRALREKA
ncbi:MAG: signal recognition particle receptor subunit alpha, partial [Terriglobus sp.]